MELTSARDGFFQKFLKNQHWSKEKDIFAELFGSSSWHIIPLPAHNFKLLNKISCCAHLMRKALRKAISTARLQMVPCPHTKSNSFIFPIRSNLKLSGLICVIHATKDPAEGLLSLFSEFTDAVADEVEREVELARLSDSIKPRTVALSTVHTLHRLISSTLDLSELLPRIARLSMQVLRANESAVMLLDKRKHRLVTCAHIILNRRRRSAKYEAIARGIAAKGTAALQKNIIAVPLIEEDVVGVIAVCDKTEGAGFTKFDLEILTTLAEQAVIAIRNAELYEEQESAAIGSIRSLAAILDLKSPYTYTHTKCFERLALALAEKMCLSKEEVKGLHYASLLPDAGKVGIPDNVLSKSTRLTQRELKAIREHPLKGASILRHMNVLRPAIPILLYHHERYDGKGYPHGLKRDQIPVGAKIMAIADAFEAMVCKNRPYQRKKSVKEAADEIKRYSGTQFDPKIVNAFLELYHKGKLEQFLRAN